MLFVKVCIECMEFSLGKYEESAESLCLRIRGQTSTADVLTGVYCSSPDQQKEADEPYFMLCRKYHSHRPNYS